MRVWSPLKKLLIFALLLALVAGLQAPSHALAQEAASKVVRVGWFDSSFCYWDQFGRRCGIDYEYQHRISAYTGWTYEYVEDSWPNLLKKLMAGEIDLLGDVSYKQERTEFLLYPDLPMGSESYYIYIDERNREITASDLTSFNGKRIGVNEGSIQAGFLKDWAEKSGLNIEIVPLTTDENESMNMVLRGQLDGFASVYTVSSEYKSYPAVRIGSSDYFYAISKTRPDLLAELNMALSGIKDDDPYFNERLAEKRVYDTQEYAFLTPAQDDWIAAHGTIRVGYLENYFPFCSTDEQTGELSGALKDFLAHAENTFGDSNVRFETKPYNSVSAALEALNAGAVDCVFPVYLSDYDSDQAGVFLTNPAMKTGMNVVTRDSEALDLSRDSALTFAVPSGSPNLETFIKEQYPACRRLVFADDKACYDAVAGKIADCTLVSNYRVPYTEETYKGYHLSSVPTGEHVPCSFAVKKADRDLYFILNKMVVTTQSGDMDSALASYMYKTQKTSFTQFMKDNWLLVLLVLTALFSVIIFLLFQRLKAQRKAHEQQRLLEEAAEVAELKQTISSLLDNMPGMNYTKDAETGVYLACNQAFAEYAHRKPEDVIGHTAAEIFDAEKAKRFTEDDRMALSMDGPYIFFEDEPDPSGRKRQIRKTKLKYTDAAGRLCVLGIAQDVTDTVRVHRGDVATKEDYEKLRGTGIIYSHIAQALARGYADLYYVDLITEEFIQYRVNDRTGSLDEVRRGWHFFEECQEEIDRDVYPDDRDMMKKALDRKTLIAALDHNNSFIITHRIVGEAGPVFVSMKVTRMQDDDRYIILGITDIDEQVKQRTAAARAAEEQIAHNRLVALAGNYLCVYVVEPETERYREFSATSGYELAFAQAKEGTDFFTTTREASRTFSHPDDLNRFLSVFTRENVLAEIERSGLFMISYRLIMNGKPRYVQLKAAMVQEKDGARLIVGINDIDQQVRQEENYVNRLSKARIEANIDTLTGVKNRHAYLMAEERLNAHLAENPALEFAVTVLDVNDLKRVNDADGHHAGDQYLRDACRIICKTFNHSPVFRIGGDEFAVISQGEDYTRIDDLIRQMSVMNEEALKSGGIVIACGMARHDGEASVAPVFERADQSMYDNKSDLKSK